MSAPNAGRQSPPPEEQSGAQQGDHPGQPGSGKVSELPKDVLCSWSFIDTSSSMMPQTIPNRTSVLMLSPLVATSTDAFRCSSMNPKARTRARKTNWRASSLTQSISWKTKQIRRRQRQHDLRKTRVRETDVRIERTEERCGGRRQRPL